MQQVVRWTGLRVFHADPPRGPGEAGLLSRRPALRRAEGAGDAVGEGANPGGLGSARSRDPEAFGEVFRAYRRDVQRLCRRLLGDDAGAEDAASEVFLRAQARLDSYDESRPLRTWLLAIAAHHCTDLLRRRSVEKRIFEDRGVDPGDFSDRGPSPLHEILRAEDRAAILAAIDALPLRYRMPLVLRHFADMDYEAIGAVLGVTRNQVGTLLFRAKRRLRSDLGGRVE